MLVRVVRRNGETVIDDEMVVRQDSRDCPFGSRMYPLYVNGGLIGFEHISSEEKIAYSFVTNVMLVS